MMKTALSIVQAFCYRNNIPAPTALTSTTDPAELQLRQVLYDVCEELRQAACWSQQKRSYEFDTVSGQRLYKLPKDFYTAVIDTHWNQTETQSLIGPLNDQARNYVLYGTASSTRNFAYSIYGPDQNPNTEGGQIWVDPLPSSAVTLSFDYLSRNLFTPQFWTPSTAYTITTSFCFVNGNIYRCTGSGTSSVGDPPSGTGTGISDNTATWAYYDEPYETILADTDLCLFDYDLVKLGLRAKWREENSGDWQAAELEFQSKISTAVGRYKGSYVGEVARSGSGPSYTVPYRSWSI